MTTCDITVFTPTFNRANLIERVFSSLQSQTIKNFEWLVIDDGSTDNTKLVLDEFKTKASFPIRYFAKNNAGKVAAINDALDLANGEWFIVFDSDDWCDSDALESISHEISLLHRSDFYNEYCAISVLKRYVSGEVVGDDYSTIDKYGKTYIDRFNFRIRGDKWEIIRTSMHKNFKYNLALGERYMAPGYAWLMMGQKYNTVFINKAYSTIEYQKDGISRNNIIHRSGSPCNAMKYYHFASECSRGIFLKWKSIINYYRFYFHSSRENKIHGGILGFFGFLIYVLDVQKINLIKSQADKKIK